MTEEDEEFNRIERESRIKQNYVRNIKTPSREALLAEVAVLTELVRVLSDKVNELQILNQPTWFIDSKHATPQQRAWVGLTDEETDAIIDMFTGDPWTAAAEIQARLKEKNT